MPSPFSINYCNRYNAPNWWLFNYNHSNHSHPFDITNCLKCMTKFKDVIFVFVASPLQHAFNLHQAVPDHGHGSAPWPEPRATTSSVWCAPGYRFSKMLLRDLKKFANFASALGISSFLHRKIGTLQSY